MNMGDDIVQLMLHLILVPLLTIWQIEKTLCYPLPIDYSVALPCELRQDLLLFSVSYLIC